MELCVIGVDDIIILGYNVNYANLNPYYKEFKRSKDDDFHGTGGTYLIKFCPLYTLMT